MFEHMARHRAITVVGCQRSGTTLAARAVALDTGFTYFDEDNIGTKDPDWWQYVMRKGKRIVVHAPAMTFLATQLRDLEDVAVVFVRRAPNAIRRSMERIGWDQAEYEVAKYNDVFRGLPDLPIEKLKRHVWIHRQRDILPNPYTVSYLSLRRHPLWVPPTLRRTSRWGKRDWTLAHKL